MFPFSISVSAVRVLPFWISVYTNFLKVETHRLGAFTDAVLAISATVLIFNVTAAAPGAALGHAANQAWPSYIGYASHCGQSSHLMEQASSPESMIESSTTQVLRHGGGRPSKFGSLIGVRVG